MSRFDLVLVVLAFAAAGFAQSSMVAPPAAVQLVQGGQPVADEMIAVRVDADHGLWIGDEPLPDVAALAQRIKRRRGEQNGEVQIVIKADREALFRVTAQALAAARESGAATCRLSVGAASGKGD